MESPNLHRQQEDHALPEGWCLVERFDGDNMVILELQRGEFGPRVSAFGASFGEALRFGQKWMERYDERDRHRKK